MPVLRRIKCYSCKAKSWQGDVLYGEPRIKNPTEAQKTCNHQWEDRSYWKDLWCILT